MAEGEIIKFGDFDEIQYRSLFGEGSLSTESRCRVQFPWDKQEIFEAPLRTTDGSSLNRDTETQFDIGRFSAAGENHHSRNVPVLQRDIQSNTTQPPATISPAPIQDPSSAINHCGPFPQESREYNASADSAQRSNSLKRRNKKQRDPSYYDNFYNNPDLYKGQAEDRDAQRPTANAPQLSNPTHGGAVDGNLSLNANNLDYQRQIANDSAQSFTGPSNGNKHIGNANNENVQLDDRTTQSQIFSNVSIQRTANLSNSTFSTSSSSSNFPSSRVPPTDIKHPSVNTSVNPPTEPTSPPALSAGTVSSSTIHKPDETAVSETPSNDNQSNSVTLETSQSAPPPSRQSGGDSKPEKAADSNEEDKATSSSRPPIAQAKVSAPKPNSWGAKPTSWASLFRKDGENSIVTHSVPDSQPSSESDKAEKEAIKLEETDPVSVDKDPQVKKLGEFLKHAAIINKPMFLQPRGLVNIGNNCYINSILQVLVACPPFYNLFQRLPLAVTRRGPTSTPMLDAILDLCKHFEEVPSGGKKGNRELRPGEPFEPTGVYQMLRKVNTTLSIKQGKQEDAEEFLSCLLNGFHDEMIGAIEAAYGRPKVEANGPQTTTPNGIASDHEAGEDEDDEWEQVGPKKKAVVTRVADFTKSPIYNIFGGQMRSALHQHGARESATLQPFFTLQLDIQSLKITSVKEALETFGTKEAVHGFMSNKTKTEVEASKRTSLEELPPVLILHLKQFVYDKTGGCQKLTKKMDYEMDLEIGKDLLSPSGKAKIPPNQRTFKLFAVVYHTGKEASGGHYISDYYHVGINSWIRADDDHIKVVKPIQVLNPPTGFTPYLLVYRRREVVPSSSSSHSG